MPNVLMIHHFRDFSSNDVCLVDDYQLANNKLYGAQKMDCWTGFRMLSKGYCTHRLQISINRSNCKLISPKDDVLGTWEIAFPINIRNRISADYLNLLFKYWDNSIPQLSSDDAMDKAIAAKFLTRSLFNGSILSDLVSKSAGNQIND